MKLNYQILYSDRKTIGITVERDASIVVRAPKGTPVHAIERAVEAKRLWLYEKSNHKYKYPAHPRRKEFVTGETLLYLGRGYPLKVAEDMVDGVRFQSGFVISRRYRAQAARLLQQWYIERAREKLPPRAKSFAEALGVRYHRILISDLRVRWASCTPKGNLNFSWRIMQAPLFVIDYLIVHELAHLLEPNHTPQFWTTVAVQVPLFERAKAWLRENGGALEEDF